MVADLSPLLTGICAVRVKGRYDLNHARAQPMKLNDASSRPKRIMIDSIKSCR